MDLLTIAAIWELGGETQRLLLIDEPDAHIHPDMQARFADLLFRLIDRFQLQIVIATHSPSLLAALGQFGGERTSVVYLQRKEAQYRAVRFRQVHRDLLTCLGGGALMGPLFGAPLLLVEGDDDYRIWSQVPRHHVTNFAVVPGHGDQIRRYQKALEIIFASLREPSPTPAGYALLDGDKPLPQASPQTPQDHIRYIRLACHEAENLYLTDEVLQTIGTTWEEAVTKIVEAAPRFGNKAEFLGTARSWDRKEVDLKNHIEEVSRILDDRNILWTVRVGRAIGKAVPTGQLRAFLGEPVVAALWPNHGAQEE